MIAMLGMIKILTLVSGVSVVLARTSIRSVLSLMMVFVGLASYWIVLGMDVLGVLLVLVYVGAVIVLFLFVVMMIGETGSALLSVGEQFYLLVGLFAVILLYGDSRLKSQVKQDWVSLLDSVANVKELGVSLFECHLHGVLGVGIVLLIAMIGGVLRVVK